VKLRYAVFFLALLALLASGCGSDDKKSDSDTKKDKPSKAEKAAQVDRSNKEKAVKEAEKAFDKKDDDVGTCRNLAMSYVALASPASTGDPKNPPKVPEDRDKSMKKAIDTLEQCQKLDPKDRDVKQMLASSYMGTNKYDKAADLLEDLAKTSKGAERANSYYAWGLAASNAQHIDEAIGAWNTFLELAPKNDPRIKQIRQSITALKAAQKQQKTQAAATSDNNG
jgi:tetratricopeptide (TPR) repeat protein